MRNGVGYRELYTRKRIQRRGLKQIHLDLKELCDAAPYDRVADFAKWWRTGQLERVNSAGIRTIGGIVLAM